MDDLISRQAAIERATKDHDFFKGATIPTDKARRDELLNVMCWLRELPSVQQENWIPCSERLPKKDGDYYVTTHNGQIARYLFIKGASEEYWMRCAVAWMPLPEPWSSGDKNKGGTA